jgi:threonine synthase
VSALTGLRCLRCAAEFDPRPTLTGCPRCAAEGHVANLTPTYDYAAVRAATSPEAWASRPRGVWRYRELLPVDTAQAVSLGEGGTPLVHLPRLGEQLGLTRLYVKDESRNPTLSFKDRMASLVVSHARQVGARTVAIASSGNAGAALAAYAARAGLECVVLTSASAPAAMMAQMLAYGATLLAPPNAADRWTLLRAGVERLGWYAASNFLPRPVGSNPFGVDAYKTIAFEIWEDLGRAVPEAVVFPVCYGDGLWGATKGFEELERLGWSDGVPRMGAAEVFGCLTSALETDADDVAPVPSESSIAISIATGLSTHQGLTALRRGHGFAGRVNDDDTLAMQHRLADLEGLFAEASSVLGLVLAGRARQDGTLRADDRVVVILTASGLKDPGPAARHFAPIRTISAPTFEALETALDRSSARGLSRVTEGAT